MCKLLDWIVGKSAAYKYVNAMVNTRTIQKVQALIKGTYEKYLYSLTVTTDNTVIEAYILHNKKLYAVRFKKV